MENLKTAGEIIDDGGYVIIQLTADTAKLDFEVLKKVEGVDSITNILRYSFLVSVGKLFDLETVSLNLQAEVLKQL